jgi:proteasome lid subunit RPN8/RPN11
MLRLSREILERIHAHGEQAYPEEGAGFLLGVDGGQRIVTDIFPIDNAREEDARHNRYQVTTGDFLEAETMADGLGLNLIGVFHSHPDHPNHPSEFDREWAQPYFSYLITSVGSGKALESRSWRLDEDRSRFVEEKIHLT